MEDNDGRRGEYMLEIEGWIGTYKQQEVERLKLQIFPIIYFICNKRWKFNILPIVGQNKLNEVCVVGELHIDLFELSELPDMALSNRQGYKTDDPRYEAVIRFVRNCLLPEILKKRDLFADLTKAKKKKEMLEVQKKNEIELKKQIDNFLLNASRIATENIEKIGASAPKDVIQQVISEAIHDSVPDLGIKQIVDSQKKRY